ALCATAVSAVQVCLMLGHLRRILAILSLLFALTTALLWLRSWGNPFHFSKESKKAIDKDRDLHRNFELHSLDTGRISIGYASAMVDRSAQHAEVARMRTRYPDILFDMDFGT